MGFNAARLRRLNEAATNRRGDYVLYWMQAYRRLGRNHTLDYAARCARDLERPLVVYEGLRLDYPWASRRSHRFVLEGMRDNAAAAAKLGLSYWPFVETPDRPARGLLRRLAKRAAVLVTDDFPCFIVPDQSAALASRVSTPVFAVDGNGVVPLSRLGDACSAAAQLRRRLHAGFAEAFAHRAAKRPALSDAARRRVDPPFPTWDATTLEATLETLPLAASVPPVPGRTGGVRAARVRLRAFLRDGLRGYAEQRSRPAPPASGHASGLSPYLHFGHVSIEEVVEESLKATGGEVELHPERRGRRDGFFGEDADLNAFLDQALTWRDLAFHWHWHRRRDTASLRASLPGWAWATLGAHAADRREAVYDLEAFEAGETHDPLWNAAQHELVATGIVHNYLRMLWGKKVIEWSKTPADAYRTLVHLNNKYALDGRDPNSYAGILWCFGLFDRPWAPERRVLGRVRYMSSENTARKFRLGAYLDYAGSLPAVAEVTSS